MKTLHQVVEGIVQTTTHDHVILSLTNAGSSSRTRRLSSIFSEEQIDALEDNCVIVAKRDLPEDIRTPESLQYALDMADAHMLTFHWVELRVDGSKVEYDIDDSRVF